MIHESLANYYETMFAMVNHHHWSLDELEDLVPFERKIYVDMTLRYLAELERGRG